MDDLRLKVVSIATKYLDNNQPSDLSVDLAVEQFRDCRNYPKGYTDEMILKDMNSNMYKIAMAVAEIDAKIGIEGQTAHSENGINRSYGTMAIPKAYATISPFATVI